MKRLAPLLIALAAAGIAWAHLAQLMPIPLGRPYTAQNVLNLVSVAPTSYDYVTGSSSGTVVGTAAGLVTGTSTAAFSGTYALSGSNAGEFTINSSTGVITTNGSTPTCSSTTVINNINVVATDQYAYGSPYTQAITITCVLNDAPEIVQHWDTATSSAGSGQPAGNNYQLNVQPTGSGDIVVLAFTGVSGDTVSSITDSASDTIPAAVCSADNGSTNGLSYLYVIAPTAGVTWFKIAFSASFTEFNYVLTEYNNIASATAQGHNCQAGLASTAGTVTPTSFTPTSNSNGNLIYNYTALATGTNSPACNASGYTPASGFERFGGNTSDWINGDGYGFQSVMQTETQLTAAAVSASVTMAGETCSSGNGDPFNSLTVALQIGAAGIAYPTSIHVVQTQQLTTDNFGSPNLPSSFSIPFSSLGNLRVFMFEAVNGNGSWDTANGTVTSSDGCNFTQVTGANTGTYVYYAQNCSPCSNCTITFPLHSGTALANTAGKFYDVINASSSSYLNEADAALSCSTGSIAADPSITPSSAPGLTLAMVGVGNGPANGATAPSGLVYAVPQFTGQSDGEHLAFGDAHAFYNYSSTTAQSWTWTIAGTGTTCGGLAAAFH